MTPSRTRPNGSARRDVHRRDIASDAGQAQPGKVAAEAAASARGLEAPGVGACVEISLHAIEQTQLRRQRRVDGVGRRATQVGGQGRAGPAQAREEDRL